jgi:hypothetical protein
MDWQLVSTSILVCLASCYLLWRSWRPWKSRKRECAGGCASSCAAGTQGNDTLVAISMDKLTVSPKHSHRL